MTDFIKVSKTQALDLLVQTGRYHWVGVRVDVRDSKGRLLPRIIQTFSTSDLEEIIQASAERRYGSITYLHADSTTSVKMEVAIRVGNVTYSVHPCGYTG